MRDERYLLARYLDGDLDEDEADRLLLAVRDDPRLAAELADHEAILAAGTRLAAAEPAEGFVDRVMASLDRAEGGPARGKRRWPAVAASLVAGLLAGALGASALSIGRGSTGPAATATPASLSVLEASARPGVEYYRAVRLVHRPLDDRVSRVGVAGSFNGWDPEAAPMRREGDVWTLVLVLPPGTHEYMFVEDGERWVTDPEAPATREDGFGGVNGVLPVRS